MEVPYLKYTSIFVVIVSILSLLLSPAVGITACFRKNWFLIFHMLLAKKKFEQNFSASMGHYTVFMPSLEVKKKRKIVRPDGGSSIGGAEDSLIIGLPEEISIHILARTCRSEFPKLACVNKKYRTLIRNGCLYNLRKQLGTIEHWVFLYMSSYQWEAFDLVSRGWIRLPQIPSNSLHLESLAVGPKLLVFGWEGSDFAIRMYTLLSNEWSRCQPMTYPRGMVASGSLGNMAIVAGGINGNGQVLKSAELYNSETGVWERLPDMNCERQQGSGFFMDGNFYVIGGWNKYGEYIRCGEEYNLETRTWRIIMGIDYKRQRSNFRTSRSFPLFAVVNNQLYAAEPSNCQYKKYDKINNTWNVVGRLPRFKRCSYWRALAFKSCGDRLLLVSGYALLPPTAIVLSSWFPEDDDHRILEWDILSSRANKTYVWDCAVMDC